MKTIQQVRIYDTQEQQLRVAVGAEVMGVGLDQEGLLLFLFHDPHGAEVQALDIAVRRDGDDCSDLRPDQYVGTVMAMHSSSGLPEDVSIDTIHVFNRSV